MSQMQLFLPSAAHLRVCNQLYVMGTGAKQLEVNGKKQLCACEYVCVCTQAIKGDPGIACS